MNFNVKNIKEIQIGSSGELIDCLKNIIEKYIKMHAEKYSIRECIISVALLQNLLYENYNIKYFSDDISPYMKDIIAWLENLGFIIKKDSNLIYIFW